VEFDGRSALDRTPNRRKIADLYRRIPKKVRLGDPRPHRGVEGARSTSENAVAAR
jgi:hypothetical protein